MDCFHIWYGLSLQPYWMNLTKFGKIHSNMATFSLSLNYLEIGCYTPLVLVVNLTKYLLETLWGYWFG